MQRKGILFVINDFNVGGAEVFVLRFGKALLKKYNVFITDLSSHRTNQEFKKQFTDKGFNYLPNKFQYSKYVDWLLWKLNALFSLIGFKHFYNSLFQKKQKKYWGKQLIKNNIQIINSHLIASDEFVLNEIYLFKNEIKFKWIITMHSSYNPLHYKTKNKQEKIEFFDKVSRIMNASDAIVGVAEENFTIFKEINISKHPKKIYLGFDPSEVKPNEQNLSRNKILMIGRGIEEKGWEIAIKAFQELKVNYENLELYLVGPLTAYMLSLKEKFPLKDLFFEDYQADPTKYYTQSFVTILPSYGESLPYTVIESLGYAVPVIVSNRGEMPEMIHTNKIYAGVVIEDDEFNLPSNKSLKNTLEKMLVDLNYYNELKSNTSLVFEKFSVNSCVKAYEKLFH